MNECVVAEELIRQGDPEAVRRVLLDAIEEGATAFYVRPAGTTFTDWGEQQVAQAQRDADLWGTGFLVNGFRVDPETVRMIGVDPWGESEEGTPDA